MNKRETQKFSNYYSKYLETLKLQGYSDSTIEAYTHAIRRIAGYFDRCPDGRLTKDELKTYFSDLLKTHSWSTIKRDRNGLQRYWSHVLELDWDWVLIVKPPCVKTLPDILSSEEINNVLGCIKKDRYAVLFYVLYTLGLRIGEGLNLQVSDIDHAHKRVHIRLGKGKKSRFVKLPEDTYLLLREFWAIHRNPKWIFPSTQAQRQHMPMDRGSVQKAIREAVKEAGIRKRITAHNMRHCFATHLIECGLNLRAVQELLGHEDPRTTALYTQLTKIVQQDAQKTVDLLASRIRSPLKKGRK